MTQDMRGYYDKYIVVNRATREMVADKTFTLVPARDEHSLPALKAYADSVAASNPGLAQDLRDLIVEYSS